LAHHKKLAAAEHSFKQDRIIQFCNTESLPLKSGDMNLIMGAIQLQLHPHNMNKEEDLKLGSS
jgi:hypothetical protein